MDKQSKRAFLTRLLRKTISYFQNNWLLEYTYTTKLFEAHERTNNTTLGEEGTKRIPSDTIIFVTQD